MRTSDIISLAASRVAAGFTPDELYFMLNATQNALYKYERPQTMIVDPDTGILPILATQAGVFQYDGPDNSWRVSRVMMKRRDAAVDYGLDNTNYSPYRTEEPIEINGQHYTDYPFVGTVDALEGGVPTINFSKDPGTTTNKFYVQAFRLPEQITSDAIELTIPDSNGLHLKYVFPAFVRVVQAFNQGDFPDAMMYIEQRIAPAMWAVLSAGAQGKSHRVTARPY